ncbi:MAG: metal-dependent transcriptional regulator [Candidatus Faecivicinus sp.]
MPIHESGENYLEAIYMLGEKQGSVRSIDVVNHLGFSKPTVSVAVHTLERNGFLNITQEGYLRLTDSGREIAERIYERHKVLSSILIALGVPEKIALEDACKLEHDLSELSFEKIKLYCQQHMSIE